MAATDAAKASADGQTKWDFPEVAGPVLRSSGRVIDFEQHARSEANASPCRPASDATQPNAVEEDIIGFFANQHSRIRDIAKSHFQTIQKRFHDATHAPSTSELDGSVNAVKGNVGRDLAQRWLRVEERYREHDRAERTRDQFQKENHLLRRPRYPESKAYHFSIILVLVIVECLANMYFFAQGNELGLLGGILQAALVSVANVGSAILVGYFVARWATHVNPQTRGLALAGVVAYVAVMVMFNLLAGHYRDLMSSPNQSFDEAIPHMMRDPLALTFHSVLLFVTGICASALGVYKGMTVDDTYPGYGDLDRDCREAAASYEVARKEVQDVVLGRVDSIRHHSEQLRAKVKHNLDTMDRCIDDLRSLGSTYRERVNRVASECRRHLKRYRDANVRIRDGIDPPPPYFSEFPDFQKPSDYPLVLPDASEWEVRARKAQDRLAEVLKHVAEIELGDGERSEMVIARFDQMVEKCRAAENGDARAVATEHDQATCRGTKDRDRTTVPEATDACPGAPKRISTARLSGSSSVAGSSSSA